MIFSVFHDPFNIIIKKKKKKLFFIFINDVWKLSAKKGKDKIAKLKAELK